MLFIFILSSYITVVLVSKNLYRFEVQIYEKILE